MLFGQLDKHKGKIKLDPISHHTKIDFKSIKDLSVKGKIIMLSEDDIAEYP